MGITLGINACVYMPRKPTEQRLRATIARNAPAPGDTPRMRRKKATDRYDARTELSTGQVPRHNDLFSYLTLLGLPVVIVLNEIYLLEDGGLPCTESLHSIGQWAP